MRNQTPRLSVVMPSYNHAQFIRQALESVLNQSYQDFEIVITDDGSSDDSVEVIRSIDDPRIKLNVFPENRGASAAANNGILRAQGEYIAILNSDDYFISDKLAIQVEFLDKHPDIAAVFSNTQLIDDDGNEYLNEHFYSNIFNQKNKSRYDWLNHFFYKGNCLCHPSVLIRKRCYEEVGLYDERLAQLPDFDYWIRLCMKYNIHILPDKLVKFRIRSAGQNASSNALALIRTPFEFYNVLKNYINITTFDELVSVLPSANRYRLATASDFEFALAMVLFEECPWGGAKLLALELLFSALGNPSRAEMIKDLYNFGCADFIELTSRHDFFPQEIIDNLNLAIVDRDRQIKNLDHQISSLRDTYSWRITAPLRWVAERMKNTGYDK